MKKINKLNCIIHKSEKNGRYIQKNTKMHDIRKKNNII